MLFAIVSVTRNAFAMTVSVGLTAPIEGKKLASVTWRLLLRRFCNRGRGHLLADLHGTEECPLGESRRWERPFPGIRCGQTDVDGCRAIEHIPRTTRNRWWHSILVWLKSRCARPALLKILFAERHEAYSSPWRRKEVVC
jgi:hypothetical protein